ncbi:MAG: hypothetical protein OHK0017_08370 [Patescibacteria group bacterium]
MSLFFAALLFISLVQPATAAQGTLSLDGAGRRQQTIGSVVAVLRCWSEGNTKICEVNVTNTDDRSVYTETSFEGSTYPLTIQPSDYKVYRRESSTRWPIQSVTISAN